MEFDEELKWRKYNDFQSYLEEDPYEMLEFYRLTSKETGVEVDIFFDDGGSYIRHEHPLWVYFRDGFGCTDRFIPVSVSDNPQIMITPVELHVSDKIVDDVKRFVVQYKDYLQKIADDEILGVDFHKFLKYKMANEIRRRIKEED